MSGGHFGYHRCSLEDTALEIERLIETNDGDADWVDADEIPYARDYSKATLDRFREGIRAIRLALTYVREIDLLVEGDTGEDDLEEAIGAYESHVEEEKDGKNNDSN